jgi:hypothetical protein
MLFGHNTVSPTSAHLGDSGISGDVAHWQQVKKLQKYNLGTFGIGSADGKGYQGFSSTKWAHHLGIPSSVFTKYNLPNKNLWLNQHSIGWEMDCLGPLEPAPEGRGMFRTAVKEYQKGRTGQIRIHPDNVQHYPGGFRGYEFYEKFTPEQIEYTRKVFLYICERHQIPTDYNEDQWDVSPRALAGQAGVWQHVSVRPDKTDCHPQPEYIAMLQGLKPRPVVVVVSEPEPKEPEPEPKEPKPEPEPKEPAEPELPKGCFWPFSTKPKANV